MKWQSAGYLGYFSFVFFGKEGNTIDYLMINLTLSHLKVYDLVNVQVLYKIYKQL